MTYAGQGFDTLQADSLDRYLLEDMPVRCIPCLGVIECHCHLLSESKCFSKIHKRVVEQEGSGSDKICIYP